MTGIEEAVNQTTREAVRKARWRYVEPPLLAFVLILCIPLLTIPFYGSSPYVTFMPDLIFIAGILVIFVGAWYDFGASAYLKELKDVYRRTPSQADMVYIHKQQLVLTGLYVLIGLLYITSAVLIYLFL